MNDSINRQDAIETIASAIWHYPNLSFLSDYDHAHELAEDALKRLPSAQSEIIHCRDCRFWNERRPQCDYVGKFGYGINDYCSKAERKEDART